jgi:hypothetical protein
MRIQDFSMSEGVAEKVFMGRALLEVFQRTPLLAFGSEAVKRAGFFVL